MQTLPTCIQPILQQLRAVFREGVWKKAKVLLFGAIVTLGDCTVAACVWVMGLPHDPRFCSYHRVLHRDHWSSLKLSAILLNSIIKTFLPETKTLVFGIDETLERRRGAKIQKKESIETRCAPAKVMSSSPVGYAGSVS